MRLKLRKGLPLGMDADDNPTYEQWMSRVDGIVRAIGCSIYDLPDCNYLDWYNARLRPIRAANRALKELR